MNPNTHTHLQAHTHTDSHTHTHTCSHCLCCCFCGTECGTQGENLFFAALFICSLFVLQQQQQQRKRIKNTFIFSLNTAHTQRSRGERLATPTVHTVWTSKNDCFFSMRPCCACEHSTAERRAQQAKVSTEILRIRHAPNNVAAAAHRGEEATGRAGRQT